jgi:penicillin-binding protein 1A
MDPSNDNSGTPKPAPTPRYVSPSGGPPVDEFFRPLPVQ